MSETYKSILERMRGNLPADTISIEGTFTGNNLSAVANELARMYSQELEPMLPRAFTATAEGEDLDNIGNDIGLERKPATNAEVMVEISGDAGSYQDILVGSEGILFMTDAFTITKEAVKVRAVCLVTGVSGNVPAGFIKEIRTSGVPLYTVTNQEAASGGYDEEKDTDYRIRIAEKKKNQVTGGNRENYRQWALAVSGVSKVKVIDLYDGPGTVAVFIIGDDLLTPPPLLIEVKKYIEAVRPCGAAVSVMAAQMVQIDVTATVVLEQNADLESVKTAFENTFQMYLKGLSFSYGKKTIISYIRMADLLFQIEGVADVTDIVLGGMKKSILMQETEFPLAGIVTLLE